MLMMVISNHFWFLGLGSKKGPMPGHFFIVATKKKWVLGDPKTANTGQNANKHIVIKRILKQMDSESVVKSTRFVKVTSFGPISDLFRTQVTSIYKIKRSPWSWNGPTLVSLLFPGGKAARWDVPSAALSGFALAGGTCRVSGLTHEIKQTDEKTKPSEDVNHRKRQDVSKAPSCGLYWNVFMFFFLLGGGGLWHVWVPVSVCSTRLNPDRQYLPYAPLQNLHFSPVLSTRHGRNVKRGCAGKARSCTGHELIMRPSCTKWWEGAKNARVSRKEKRYSEENLQGKYIRNYVKESFEVLSKHFLE